MARDHEGLLPKLGLPRRPATSTYLAGVGLQPFHQLLATPCWAKHRINRVGQGEQARGTKSSPSGPPPPLPLPRGLRGNQAPLLPRPTLPRLLTSRVPHPGSELRSLPIWPEAPGQPKRHSAQEVAAAAAATLLWEARDARPPSYPQEGARPTRKFEADLRPTSRNFRQRHTPRPLEDWQAVRLEAQPLRFSKGPRETWPQSLLGVVVRGSYSLRVLLREDSARLKHREPGGLERGWGCRERWSRPKGVLSACDPPERRSPALRPDFQFRIERPGRLRSSASPEGLIPPAAARCGRQAGGCRRCL